MKTRVLLFIIAVILSKAVTAQEFGNYVEKLRVFPQPNNFDQWPDSLQNHVLPADLFNQPIFDLNNDRAFARIELDADFIILLVGWLSDEGDYFHSIMGYSYDLSGSYIDNLSLSHDAIGEGSTFSITPEGKIRVASYGASEAIIWTYRYENGRFIREGDPEYGDVDNLPDY